MSESKYNISDYTLSQARLNGETVQIGDNQVFRSLRDIQKINIDTDKVRRLFDERDSLKQSLSSQENLKLIQELQNKIDDMLFVSDVINVKVDDKKAYKKIFKEGFVVNGKRYLRLCSGSGQSRKSTASFVNVDVKNELEKKLNCGLNLKRINVAKYNAYFGLNMSVTYPVRSPRVCLIDDCEKYKLKKTVDWIEDIDPSKNKNSRRVIRKEIDFIPNMWDGQGLISPQMAKLWKEDLDLDYLPSSFGIRSAFIKGQLVVFDFHKFAEKIAKTDKIVDYYGKEWYIEDIDILLSVSQFKMYKYYTSWDEYVQLHEHHGHSWGVTKVNPKVDDEMSLLNYQYIQTLDLDRNKIEKLIQPTIDWIENICSGNKLFTLLLLLGSCKDSDTVSKIFNKTNSNFVKAILYNESLLKDPYIRKKIYDSISTKIKEAKIGRVWVRGNYQAMVSDPFGQAQWAFKKDVTGLLNEHEHYSRFWIDKKVTKVDACRSPMVDFHEHNILNFQTNNKMRTWYKYINSGIIYNVWGVDTIRHSDSDWDYDIVFTTDNDIMISSIFPAKNVITYEKVSAPSQTLSSTNILNTDLRSFDSKVGTITNYSTTFITMLSNFKKNSSEYNELIDRIKLLRRYIGDSIDQAKGIKMKPFPQEWKRREFLREDDSDEVKKTKYYHNSLVANKKPYFMIYIYDKVKNEYKEYKKKCERTCREKFGCTLEQLINKSNKNKQEIYYVSDYYRRMPVIKNKSAMNVLCNIFDSIDFKYKRPNNSENVKEMFDILFDTKIEINHDILNKLNDLYKKFNKKRHFKYKNDILKYLDFESEQDSENNKRMNEFYEEIRNEAYTICSNSKELANHLIYITYQLNPNDSKEFAWSIAAEGILDILKDKSCGNIQIPMPDKNGEEYLGQKFTLRSLIV